MNKMSIAELGVVALAAAIATGEVSSEAATQGVLDALRVTGPRLNCVVALDGQEALEAARAADQARAGGRLIGALHGVPLAHKDIFMRQGKPVTAGSRLMDGFVADRTATVLARLQAAGSIQVGTLQLSEFARSPTGYNRDFGSCRNPWDLVRVSGGSSSGSAAAVAAGLIPGSLGTDTGGSIRIPAAMCGVVGLKPTYGAVSRAGVLPVAWSLDSVGPLGRTAADCTALFDAVAGSDVDDPATAWAPSRNRAPTMDAHGLTKTRIAVLPMLYDRFVTLEIAPALAEVRRVLRDAGATIVECRFDDFELLDAAQIVVREVEAATVHSRRLRADPSAYADQIRVRMESGFLHVATRYNEALALRAMLLDRFGKAVFAHADMIFTPAVPVPVPTILETSEGLAAEIARHIAAIGDCVRQIGFLGLPAIAIPCGFDPNGMPIGFQLVGRPFSERRLLSAAASYQARTEWHLRRPPLQHTEGASA